MMNCYYHTSRPAVTQCTACGKGLCKECADQYYPDSFCCDCIGTAHQEAARKERTNRGLRIISAVLFCIPVIPGILFSLILFFHDGLGLGEMSETMSHIGLTLLVCVGIGLALGGAAFGFRFFWRFWICFCGSFNFFIIAFSGPLIVFSFMFDLALFFVKIALYPALAFGFGWIVAIVEWIKWLAGGREEQTEQDYRAKASTKGREPYCPNLSYTGTGYAGTSKSKNAATAAPVQNAADCTGRVQVNNGDDPELQRLLNILEKGENRI